MGLRQKVSKLILGVNMGYDDFLVFDKIPDLMIDDFKMLEFGMGDGILGRGYSGGVVLKYEHRGSKGKSKFFE